MRSVPSFLLAPLLLAWCGLAVSAAPGKAVPPAPPQPDRISYIANDQIKLGVNLDLGGSITWLSAPVEHPGNLVNNADWGRQIQLSFYSGPHPFEPNGKKAHAAWKNWSWNPIQSGDVYGNRAKVIAHTNNGKEITLTCIPMQWALNNEPGDCRFEVRITLDGPMAKVHYRLLNQRADKTRYPGSHQELPAIYTISALNKLVTYTGNAPFTNAPLSTITNDWKKKFPWSRFLATEGWVAAVNADDWGLAVCNPEVYSYLGGRHTDKISSVSTAGPTMYISPVTTEILDANISYDFDLFLRVGKLPELRRYFTGITAPLELPRWSFGQNRQHWQTHDCTDSGWPMSTAWRIIPTPRKTPVLESPVHPWRAESAPRLRVTGIWKNITGAGRVVCHLESSRLTFKFDIPKENQAPGIPVTVEINLAANPEYRGLVNRLTLVPSNTPPPVGAEFQLYSVELRAADSTVTAGGTVR